MQTDLEIQFLPGVGPRRARLLKEELGLVSPSDLIRFYPFRYVDRSSITPIASITSDVAYVQFRGRVITRQLMTATGPLPQDGQPIRFNTVKRLIVVVTDGGGQMELVFFKAIKWMYEKMTVGSEFLFFGKPQSFNSGEEEAVGKPAHKGVV